MTQLYSWGSLDPGPRRYQWVTMNYPIGCQALPGGWDMFVVDGSTGDEWLVPGTHHEDSASKIVAVPAYRRAA